MFASFTFPLPSIKVAYEIHSLISALYKVWLYKYNLVKLKNVILLFSLFAVFTL